MEFYGTCLAPLRPWTPSHWLVPGRFSPDFNVFLILLRSWEILSGFQCVPSLILSGFQCVPSFIVSLEILPDFNVFLVLLCPWEILSGFQCVPSFIVSLEILSGFQCVPSFNVSLGDSLRISMCSLFQCVPGKFSVDFNAFPVLLCPWEIFTMCTKHSYLLFSETY